MQLNLISSDRKTAEVPNDYTFSKFLKYVIREYARTHELKDDEKLLFYPLNVKKIKGSKYELFNGDI